jgi:hypothetical protein
MPATQASEATPSFERLCAGMSEQVAIQAHQEQL